MPDSEAVVSFELALDETQKIAEGVNILASMDAEKGYGVSSELVSSKMKKIVATFVG